MGGEGRFLVFDCTGSVDCGGLAGEFRSVSWALYASMISRRALFIRWERHGQDMADLMGMQAAIDWRPPASLLEENCVDMGRVKQKHGMTDLLHNDTVPCVRVFRALTQVLNLSMHSDDLSDFEDVGAAYNAWDTLVPKHSTYACAAHFLFTFTPAFERLVDNVELVVSPGSIVPDNFVAIHMRFGDRVMNGSDTGNFSIVTEALACANALLQKVMSSETSWGIFFASDSAAARQFAMASSSGHPVFTTGELPTHMTINENASIWGSLGDFLMLASAQGLVLWTNPVNYTAFGRPINISSFSYIPAELSFMPLDHMRVLEKDVDGFPGCGLTSRQVSILG